VTEGLLDLRIASLAEAYRSRRATPAAVAERVHDVARMSAAGNAWIALVDREALLARARLLEEAGPAGLPLYGIPFAVKDNVDVAGLPTTAGCPSYAYVPERDATVVARLLAAGAMLVGKTNMDQFATGLVGTRSPYGACASVYDPAHVSGGSSSGSGVVVADGTVSFAVGTDTAGSGRVPAAFNGIVGVKPTRGLASTAGMVPAVRSLDCPSVFASDVDGARRVLAAMVGWDPADPGSRAAPPGRGPAAGAPRRLGVPALASLGPLAPAHAEAWAAAVELAHAVADEVVEVDAGPIVEAGRLLYDGPWVGERYAAVGAFVAAGSDDLDPVVRTIVEGGAAWTAADMAEGRRRLGAIAAQAAPLWEACDALVLPTTPGHPTHAEVAADPLGVNADLGRFTHAANLLDLSAVAVPAGLRADGLPFGVQLLGPAFADARLLDLAARWEAAAGAPAGAAVDVAVCGAHLRGLALHHQLVALGARFVEETATAPRYRLFALPGGPPRRPGLVRAAAGAAIAVEVWRMPVASLGRLTAAIPAPLAIGTVELEGGRTVRGFVCEGHATAGAEDVTAHGGWRAYLAAEAARPGGRASAKMPA